MESVLDAGTKKFAALVVPRHCRPFNETLGEGTQGVSAGQMKTCLAQRIATQLLRILPDQIAEQARTCLLECAGVYVAVVMGPHVVEHDQVSQPRHMMRLGERCAGADGRESGRDASLHGAPELLSGSGVERDEVIGPATCPCALELVPTLRVAHVEGEQLPTAALRAGHRELLEQDLGDEVLPGCLLSSSYL
ncbi:hypothetical protein ACH4L5_22960 [Streptomyces sp. NPDC017405]|uniref:hypothetical protein n=1 Tax=unclassified Streptomyces TaxID=2593676 RepID=UPI0037885505